jgi:amino acid transporter
VLGAILLVIVAGLTHFNPARAFTFAPGAFNFSSGFITGLGAAMLVATYDYWGYYNVCFLGAEIKRPERNIPRAILISIVAVATLYLLMNISILGVLPWQELDQAAASESRFYVASTLLQRTFGTWWGMFGAFLIMWTAFASVFSLMLGYSRVPYAAAQDGNFFRPYAKLHPKNQFPHRSLLTLGIVATLFCMLRLQDVIAALVVIRIMVQFLMQVIGLLLLRARRPDFARPFRMYFYPIPAVLAALGFIYILYARPNLKEIKFGIGIAFVGIILFLARSWQRKEWPFSRGPAHDPVGEAVQ